MVSFKCVESFCTLRNGIIAKQRMPVVDNRICFSRKLRDPTKRITLHDSYVTFFRNCKS